MTRPHVICHMISPLDGRLMTQPWAPSGTPFKTAILAEYQRLHIGFKADAWIAGTTTMEDFATGKAGSTDAPSTKPSRPWFLADTQARHFAIALDRHARLHWASPIADEGHVVVVLGASVSDAHLAELVAGGISYLVMPGDDIDLAVMLTELHGRLNIRTLLLEGGAKINGAFLQAGLVDEISLLLAPAIDGSTGSPAFVEAGENGLGAAGRLELMSAEAVAAGAVHLRYRLGVGR